MNESIMKVFVEQPLATPGLLTGLLRIAREGDWHTERRVLRLIE